MPSACPTSALAAAAKPMHGKNEKVSICDDDLMRRDVLRPETEHQEPTA